MKQVLVVGGPQGNQIGPCALLVALRGDPFILGVSGHLQRFFDLRADKAVMIVSAGIDQVAENLFARPFALRSAAGTRRPR